MQDISFTGTYEITMHKLKWADNEIALAKCINFKHSIESSTVVCDLTVTSKTAILEFIKESFQSVWGSPAQANFKAGLLEQIDKRYDTMRMLFDTTFLIKLGYQEKLFIHQKDTLFESFKKQHNFYALEQGLGKTIIAGSLSKMLSIRRTLIICPASLKHNWYKELCGPVTQFNQMYFSILDANRHRTIKAFQERFVICNFDSLEKHMDHILSSEIGHIIIDECFPPNTPITTDKGVLTIGYIVENKISCNALSFDSLNNVYSYKPVTNYFKKELKNKIVKIKHEYGELICTEDHKIWTKNGFKRAKELLENDSVQILFKNGGQTENGNFKFVRVESVEVLERGSGQQYTELCPENYVYDIEVADNHNYFANNVLVSNCVAIKSTSTGRFKMCEKIVKANPNAKVTLLSGTPVRNRVNDIYAYLRITNHALGHNYAHFLREYTISQKGRGNQVRITGAKNTDVLWRQISNFMIRKRKEDCLDLPDKIYGKLHFDLNDYKAEYDKAVKEALEQSGKTSLNSSVHSINIVTSKAKVKGVIEFAESIIDQGEKVVIFTGYTDIIHTLQDHFGDKCVMINGSVHSEERMNRVDRFMTDDTCMVFIGQTLAAGTGLTLTVASNMIFCDFPFSPADLVQAEDRCHRISQKKAVNIFYAVADESIDDHLYDLICQKAHDASKVIDNHSGDFINQNIQEMLISKLREQTAISSS